MASSVLLFGICTRDNDFRRFPFLTVADLRCGQSQIVVPVVDDAVRRLLVG